MIAPSVEVVALPCACHGSPRCPSAPLVDVPVAPRWLAEPSTRIEKRFAEFHADNPHIFEELEERALRLRTVGAKRIGVAALFEAMRYDHAIRTRGDSFKLNNSFRSLYARLLIHRHPALAEVIETRRRSEVSS